MLTKDELYRLYVEDGMTTTAIAQKIGVTDVTIGNWLRRYGIPARARKKPAEPIEARFAKSYRVDDNGCWIWTKGYAGGRSGRYGMLRLPDGSSMSAHRLSYTLHHGPIGSDLIVCHRCDVTACVNPEHLFLGTAKDNVDDMIRKGRQRPHHKISDDVVNIIRNSADDCATLAKRFGIDRGHAWRIKTGRARTNRRAQMNLR